AWIVDTKYPHRGTYCASVVGNNWIRQFIDTVPANEIQSVTFWSRQPDQPAAQAFDFFYSDGSYEEFVHFPQPDWQQFDVTYRLNRSKSLVGLGIWGYSGGGPGPDSTYLDDVSIQVRDPRREVGITSILSPRDTIPFDSANTPIVQVRNFGETSDSLRVVVMVEDICDPDPYYWDTAALFLAAGATASLEFEPWQPRWPAMHRVSSWVVLEGNANRDTVRQFFWVRPGTGVAEQEARTARAKASIVRGVLWLTRDLTQTSDVWDRVPRPLLDASGRKLLDLRPGPNDVSRLVPGVYFVRHGPAVRRVLVIR
ncbi:MAG: hypothetical protein ABIK86_04695, partial [candidate division WOR-3 bacterium]